MKIKRSPDKFLEVQHTSTSQSPLSTGRNSKNSTAVTVSVSLDGLGVPWSPRGPRFVGSNPAEVDGFFRT